MGTEVAAAPEPSSTPKLPLFSIIPLMQSSPERSGMLTPPLHTSASVPFRWEEEPGKPRPCTALITTTLSHQNSSTTNNFCLELPPRLQLMDSSSFKMTKMPSPTTVLDGPYLPVVSSSSFRFGRERQGSFGNNSSCGSPERGQLGAMVLSNRRTESSKERGGLFGSWGGKSKPKPTTLTLKSRGTSTKKEVGGGSFVFSSSMDLEDYFCGGGGGGEEFRVKKKMSRIRRNGSFSSLSQVRSHFWGTIYEGFKQVLPWKSRKSKNDGFIN